MMKYVKVIGIVVIVLALLAAAAWHIWGKNLAETAKMGAAFGAKHVCSCVHVAEQPLEVCKQDFVAAEDFKDFTFEDDGTTITVTAPLGLGTAKARFEPGLGCALVKP